MKGNDENTNNMAGDDRVRLVAGRRLTPDHGSDERRQMLEEAYRRNRERYLKAKNSGDRAECCRLRGLAHSFRQSLQKEYGVEL